MAELEHNQGKKLLQWTISEHHLRERGIFWYLIVGVIAVILLIYAISARNFLFAFIIIMFGVIVATHSLRPVVDYEVIIAEHGIKLGEKFYLWKDIQQFWIAQEPLEIKILYLEFPGLRPRLPISLADADPSQVREVLSKKIAENTSNTEEPISDWLARVLKI